MIFKPIEGFHTCGGFYNDASTFTFFEQDKYCGRTSYKLLFHRMLNPASVCNIIHNQHCLIFGQGICWTLLWFNKWNKLIFYYWCKCKSRKQNQLSNAFQTKQFVCSEIKRVIIPLYMYSIFCYYFDCFDVSFESMCNVSCFRERHRLTRTRNCAFFPSERTK